MKGKITKQRLVRRSCILSASGMANETASALRTYKNRGWFGLLSWRARGLERDFAWMLADGCTLLDKYLV